ncbi:5034_t:CDS:2, partial [Scutellospora calospora]
ELRYLYEAFPWSKRLITRIFSFVMIFVLRPALIIAEAFAVSLYLIYAIRGKNEETHPLEYLNPIKLLALSIIVIVGLIQLKNVNFKNHWTNIFNDTISEQRTSVEQVGSYGGAILEVLFTYEVVSPTDAVLRGDTSQIIAIYFGEALIGKAGKKYFSLLVSISSCATISAMIHSGSRIIVYATRNDLITLFNRQISSHDKRFNTPINALVFQLIYCTVLTIFIPEITNIVYVPLYLTILYYGVTAIGLM